MRRFYGLELIRPYIISRFSYNSDSRDVRLLDSWIWLAPGGDLGRLMHGKTSKQRTVFFNTEQRTVFFNTAGFYYRQRMRQEIATGENIKFR
jgi:hypothetical protein